MMAIYAADAQELLPHMPPIVGRDAIREFYRGVIKELLRCLAFQRESRDGASNASELRDHCCQ